MTRHLSPERDLDLDLDRAAARQRGHADRGAAVTTGRAEHVGEEPARAVDDRGLLREPGRARDEAEHGEHPLDAIEIAELGLQHRQRVQRAPARRLRALLDGEVVAEQARVHEHAVVVARELTRRARPAAVHDHRVERIVRRERTGQRRARAR